MTRILLVEDDSRIAKDIEVILNEESFIVERAKDGEKAWFLGDTENYAAIILDLGLPKLDGLTLLKRWRANNIPTPVLILSARGAWSERVDGINAGADDYLPKPFQSEELIARLRALIRRHAGQSSAIIVCGEVSCDENLKRVTYKSKPVGLSQLEYRLVVYLMRHANKTISQYELIEHIYAADAEPDSNALEVLVARVRKKINPIFIETKRGFGYCIKKVNGH